MVYWSFGPARTRTPLVTPTLGGGPTARFWHPWVGILFSIAVIWMHAIWQAEMRTTDADRAWTRQVKKYIENRDEEPVTLQEIGDEFGISRERVRQIEARVKKRFADYLRQQVPDIKDIEFGA